jgi:outer membrane protein insertion porin family
LTASRAAPARALARFALPLSLVVATLLLATPHLYPQAVGVQISEIVVEGTQTIDPQRVRALSGLRGDGLLTPRVMQQAIRTLWKTYLFNDIQIDTRPADGGVTVVLTVEEAPVVTALKFDGVDEVSETDVEAALKLRPGDRLVDSRVHQAELDVRELYQVKGFYLANVRIEAQAPAADSTLVSVIVSEGRKVAIKAIEFDGNETFSDKKLRKELETEPEGFWFWKDGEFDEARWRADLSQVLPSFYGRHGYLDMRVVSDSLTVDETEGKMRLFATVDEGTRYRTGNIEIEGNTRFSRTDLRGFVKVESGRVFDTAAVQETQADLLNLYADDGYIYAQVQPIRRVRPDTALVDLTWQIREGTPAHIQRVSIKGNTVTHESVIRRQLFVQPGERFRRTDVRNSLLALEGLGFFEPGIIPTTRVVDQETGDIDLSFELTERRTGSLSLGAAVGGGTGLSGFIGYEQPNLFGRARLGRIRWEFGSRNQNIELGYTEPVFLGTRTSLSTSFFSFDRRFTNQAFRQDALGASVRFGTPLPWDDATRVFYGYKWQRVDLEDTTGSNEELEEEYPRTESSLTLGLVRDTRLPRRHPIQGARHALNVDFAGGPLGGNVGFHKYEFESSWFASTFNDRTTINLKFKTGGINSTGFVPITEQFVLGGVQFPAEGLRGYRDNCVGLLNSGSPEGDSCGSDRGNAFLILTAEHFFKISDTIYASVFYDAGDVFREFRDMTFADLKRGAGIGVSVELPGVGPLGIDYGYGFDRRDVLGNPDPGWELHFRFGMLQR